MNKLIITKWNSHVLTMLTSDRNAVSLDVESNQTNSLLNNIYIGKVDHIVKNINAAFVDLGEGQKGYYSLTENTVHHYTTPHSGSKLKEGDEIVVQISRDGVKTKAPVLTGNLNFTGKYCVLTAGKNTIGFSAKLPDSDWKKELRQELEARKQKDFGIIVRTNAAAVTPEIIFKELEQLEAQYRKLMGDARYRTCFSLLYRALPAYITGIRDTYAENLESIVTDDFDIFQELKDYLTVSQPEDAKKLAFYDDALLPLSKLYQVETVMERALNKHVWLKSGGYLVIEPTEALVVIDVNTGKYAGRKNLRDTIMKINLEAAAEVGKQLRIRNLSGIIIIDFIDMETEEDKLLLMDTLTRLLSADPIKTTVVGISKLNLVEVTRKKVRKPLYEQI